MAQEETRKGPWTEHEDYKLVYYVNMFGDRRWDFIAKVSGLKRSGKSCRLRWVNYLHPGLKRGKMTPQEEKLVLELHSKWGNRWSSIARKLPGRTDNEIKNYWRTQMRKQAKEKKTTISPSSSISNCSSSASHSPLVDMMPSDEINEPSFYDTGGPDGMSASGGKTNDQDESETEKGYSMDEIWKDIELSEAHPIKPINNAYYEEGCNISSQMITSPIWDYAPEFLWMTDNKESKMFFPTSKQFYSPENAF